MQQPTLVVMAAGMGSRFGGLKQLTAVDEQGQFIIDYSMFDAYRAGFRRAAFIIKHSIEAQFRETVGRRMEQKFDVQYVFQEPDVLPPGYSVPAGRVKPWGTAHAVACCRGAVDGPFAVINADDFYGAGAFRTIYDFLAADRDEREQAMVGYRLRNTVTDSGAVARGICTAENGLLRTVTERVKIEKRGDAAVYIEDGREYPLTGDETVSMNFWGFSPMVLDALWARFPAFLDEHSGDDALGSEYFLPAVVSALLQEEKIRVRVLECGEIWHGVTYREDLQSVRDAVAALKRAGVYPDWLWD